MGGKLFRSLVLASIASIAVAHAYGDQHFVLDGANAPKAYDGVGAVSGGGATSVLLKDYPEPQRSQILDLLFKPNFAAAMPTLYVEVGSDGNATQGTEPTHARSRGDQNLYRGYEWWLMREAKQRNPDLTLDACAWGAPGWVGEGEFRSQDMADYYVSWIKGLKTAHGLDLDAVGVRNEKGVATAFIKLFKHTLNAAGLNGVRLHGFDSAGNKSMWDWLPELDKDPELAAAVDIVSNHCVSIAPMPAAARDVIERNKKPVWNTEEHVYNSDGRSFPDDYAVALGTLHYFNENFIAVGATKTVNWYLVGSTYSIEPYADQPPPLIARSPWSGHYTVKPALWAYAHYGQFAKLGWHYLTGGCAMLDGGGSVVSLKGDGGDFSVIAETAGAKAAQTMMFTLAGGLSNKPLCVWRSTRDAQFAQQANIAPSADGAYSITLEPNAMYSLSTTAGQQKGTFADVPDDAPFPLPYFETFDADADARNVGYLPKYTADICGVFELADRPDHNGKCLRQVVARKANSWAPEWMPYTILGDDKWTNYEISADVSIESHGWAGVMARVTRTGNGWDGNPDGYYARLYQDGGCAIYLASEKIKGPHEKQLAIGNAKNFKPDRWHNLKLRCEGTKITLLIDNVEALSIEDSTLNHGVAGLICAGESNARSSAMYDNLRINKVGDEGEAKLTPSQRAPLYAAPKP